MIQRVVEYDILVSEAATTLANSLGGIWRNIEREPRIKYLEASTRKKKR